MNSGKYAALKARHGERLKELRRRLGKFHPDVVRIKYLIREGEFSEARLRLISAHSELRFREAFGLRDRRES